MASNELRVLDVATGEVTPLVGMDGSLDISNVQFSPRVIGSSSSGRATRGQALGLWSIGVDSSEARLVVAGTAEGTDRVDARPAPRSAQQGTACGGVPDGPPETGAAWL